MSKWLVSSLSALVGRASSSCKVIHLNAASSSSMTGGQSAVLLSEGLIGSTTVGKRFESFARFLAVVLLVALAAAAANAYRPEERCAQGESKGEPVQRHHFGAKGKVDAVGAQDGVEGASESAEDYC
jgi:hypothetical protein